MDLNAEFGHYGSGDASYADVLRGGLDAAATEDVFVPLGERNLLVRLSAEGESEFWRPEHSTSPNTGGGSFRYT